MIDYGIIICPCGRIGSDQDERCEKCYEPAPKVKTIVSRCLCRCCDAIPNILKLIFPPLKKQKR